MRLLKLLIALIAIHMGLGFTQLVVYYYAGDVANYGAGGWISHTPIGTFVNVESESVPQTEDQANPSNLKALLNFANNLGDAINGLASFGYGFLEDIQPSDGLVYTVVMILRIVSTLFWLALGLALIYFLFDSNLLTSKLGLALVGFGLGLGSLSAIGAGFGE